MIMHAHRPHEAATKGDSLFLLRTGRLRRTEGISEPGEYRRDAPKRNFPPVATLDDHSLYRGSVMFHINIISVSLTDVLARGEREVVARTGAMSGTRASSAR
jgi:hypothetical protein